MPSFHFAARRLAAVCAFGLGFAAPALSPAAQLITSSAPGAVFLAAPADDSRLFVVQRSGVISTIGSGGALTPYLNVSGLVDTDGERGLLGLAFAPDFATSGRFYVDYIDKTTKNTVVAAYQAPSAQSATADPSSARTILTVAQPAAGYTNHKAGWIGFRPGDGNNLYIATGDGGSGNDPDNRAQNLNDNLGKLLRVAPDPVNGGYTAPADNPFVNAAGNDEIWAYGLRNPYRNSFDRRTGDLWIGDVGQDAREEIDFEAARTAGRNYGWRPLEGSADNPAVGDAAPANATGPLYDYARSTGMGRSVIGGYVYRGGDPSFEGTYFFGDFITGRIFSLRRNGASFTDLTDRTAEFGTPFGGFQLTSFGEDAAGALYATGQNGSVYRLIAAAAVPEPGSWALMGLGLAALAVAGTRRRPATAG